MRDLTASDLDGLIERLSASQPSEAPPCIATCRDASLGLPFVVKLVVAGLLQILVTTLSYAAWLFPIMAVRDGDRWSGWWAGWALATIVILWSRNAAQAFEQNVARDCCAAMRRAVAMVAIDGRTSPGGGIAALQSTAEAETIDADAVRASCITIAAAVEIICVLGLTWWTGHPDLATGIGLAFAGASAMVAMLWRAASRDRLSRNRCENRLIERIAAQRTWRIQGGLDARDPLVDELGSAATDAAAHDRFARLLCVVPSSAVLGIGTIVAFLVATPGSGSADVLVPIAATILASMGLLRLGQAATVAMPAIAAYAGSIAGSRDLARRGHNETEGPCAGPEHFVLVAHQLLLRGRGRRTPILDRCSLTVGVGERVRIVGQNGAGRSSLIEVLAGRRAPSGGVLLPRAPSGARAEAASLSGLAAPPIGERGLLFSGTLLWNLTLAACRPATAEDRARVESVLRDLGLDGVLSKMPAGLEQWVGEGGWRFSDGELARLQVARALLQQTPIILLDDPFASLDPQTREACMRAIERSSASIVLVEPS